jgi:1,4-alpha-glucan branching enzyme
MKLSDELYLFNEGRNFQAYRLLGAHPDQAGTTFRVWAPNASQVSVIGDFNAWQGAAHGMHELGASGIWELLVPEAAPGTASTVFEITNRDTGDVLIKADPYARGFELRPGSAAYVVPPSGHVGATLAGCSSAAAGTGSTRRSISTKSMPVPGCATPMASPTCGANWPND